MQITQKCLLFVVCGVLLGYQQIEAVRAQNPMSPAFLLEIIKKIEHGQNVTFTKYGDGEYFCMLGSDGGNCDGDAFHAWLADSLKKTLIKLCRKPNTYIAKWWDAAAYNFCNDLARKNGVTVPWAWYHLIMNGDEFLYQKYMYQFVEFIQKTKRKKIVICNKLNARIQKFFKADVCVEVPQKNWSFEYPIWKEAIEKHIEKDCILLISAGLCSKILIDDLTDRHQITCLDLGSAFDILARKENSRNRQHTYQDEIRYYKNLLPDNWD